MMMHIYRANNVDWEVGTFF